MSVVAVRNRRAERYAATRREILDAAWELVRADGLGSLSMRDLGARVGMRAQSLYVYFPSKYAIFDGMFANSNHELLSRLTAAPTRDAVEELRFIARVFLEFCVEDPVRYQHCSSSAPSPGLSQARRRMRRRWASSTTRAMRCVPAASPTTVLSMPGLLSQQVWLRSRTPTSPAATGG